MICVNLTTDLHGVVDLAAARRWRQRLEDAIRATPAPTDIRLLVVQRDYRPADLDVHRLVRAVVPEVRAEFADPSPRRIVACALVHDDTFKMRWLDRHRGRADQRFFSDVEAARTWLASAPDHRSLALPAAPDRRPA